MCEKKFEVEKKAMPPPLFQFQKDRTNYLVGIAYNPESEENVSDKMKKLIREDVKRKKF